MHLRARGLKSLNFIEKILPRLMAASDEMDLITFSNELYSLVRCIPKHNVLIIGRDMNAQITSMLFQS